MFVRIVKMSFQEDKVEEFLQNFNENKVAIRSYSGCQLLELYRDKNNQYKRCYKLPLPVFLMTNLKPGVWINM